MRKGYVRIPHRLICDAFKFPPDWEIEEIKRSTVGGIELYGESLFLISGSDFPETNNRGDAEEVKVIVHQEARSFEVVKV